MRTTYGMKIFSLELSTLFS